MVGVNQVKKFLNGVQKSETVLVCFTYFFLRTHFKKIFLLIFLLLYLKLFKIMKLDYQHATSPSIYVRLLLVSDLENGYSHRTHLQNTLHSTALLFYCFSM